MDNSPPEILSVIEGETSVLLAFSEALDQAGARPRKLATMGLSAYVDGNPAGSNNIVTVEGLANGADLRFGGGNTGFYDGALDEVRIYRKVLSTTEIEGLFSAP